MPEPLIVSPSLLGRYFFLNCERMLRFSATPTPRRSADGVPSRVPIRSVLQEAILEGRFSSISLWRVLSFATGQSYGYQCMGRPDILGITVENGDEASVQRPKPITRSEYLDPVPMLATGNYCDTRPSLL